MPYRPFVYGAASAAGVDPDLMDRIARIESGGNPNAVTGSYKGLFQLSDNEFAKHGGGNIFNAADNSLAYANKLKAETAAFENKYGRQPTATEIYLTHQQGQGGFDAHNANPNRPAWQNMFSTAEGRQKGEAWAKKAIWGNVPDQLKPLFGSVDNITSQQFVDLWRSKVEGGALTPPTQGNRNMAMYDEAQPVLSPSFTTGGGLGALFGGVADAYRSGALGNRAERAAMWMQSLDNPEALKAIVASHKPQDEFSLVQGQDGTMYRISKKTGAVSSIAGGQKLPDGAFGKLQEGYDKATILHGTSQEAAKIHDWLKSGQLDLGLTSMTRAAVENTFGTASDQTQKYNAFQQFRTEGANAILQAAKGTQTEGDAQRAYQQFVSGLAANDSATVQNSIKKLIEINGKLIGSSRTGFEAYKQQYPNAAGLRPYLEGYDKMMPFYAPRDDASMPPAAKTTSGRKPLGDIFK
jgi:hypothetical protein